MKKNNQKGFVLLETVVVAVFIIGIFTFVYTSIVPLLGRYDDLANNYELEKTYKLYHVRDALYKDDNFFNITSQPYKKINANDFANKDYYNSLVDLLFEDDYQIIYIKDIKTNMNAAFTNLNIKGSFREYIENIEDKKASVDLANFLFLKDGNQFAYLGLATDLNDLTKYN